MTELKARALLRQSDIHAASEIINANVNAIRNFIDGKNISENLKRHITSGVSIYKNKFKMKQTKQERVWAFMQHLNSELSTSCHKKYSIYKAGRAFHLDTKTIKVIGQMMDKLGNNASSRYRLKGRFTKDQSFLSKENQPDYGVWHTTRKEHMNEVGLGLEGRFDEIVEHATSAPITEEHEVMWDGVRNNGMLWGLPKAKVVKDTAKEHELEVVNVKAEREYGLIRTSFFWLTRQCNSFIKYIW